MKFNVMKPGLLVSLKTTLEGGVSYQRKTLESAVAADEKAAVAKWETIRTIQDFQEHTQATEIRGKARYIVASTCIDSLFGLLCPEDQMAKLEEAFKQASAMVAAFNGGSKYSKVGVYMLVGRIVSDEQAQKAIAAEMAELTQQMEEGINAVNPLAIREAANKAKKLGAMLEPDVARQVNIAVEQAREAAKVLVRRVQKEAEKAADVIADLRIDKIQSTRFMFLDLDSQEATTPELVPIKTAALDLVPAPTPEVPAVTPATPETTAAPAA